MHLSRTQVWVGITVVLVVAAIAVLVWAMLPEDTLLPPRVDHLLKTP